MRIEVNNYVLYLYSSQNKEANLTIVDIPEGKPPGLSAITLYKVITEAFDRLPEEYMKIRYEKYIFTRGESMESFYNTLVSDLTF